MTLQETRAARFRFLNAMYEVSGGDRFNLAEWRELGESLGMGEEFTSQVLDYLHGEGLVRIYSRCSAGLTHEGVRQVEDALSHPDRPTHYFPPVNVINVGNMVNSTFMHASPGASQSVQVSNPADRGLLTVLSEIKQSVDRLGLNAEQLSNLKGDVATVEAQLTTSKPKTSVVSACLTSIRGVLEKGSEAVATGLAGKLVEYIAK